VSSTWQTQPAASETIVSLSKLEPDGFVKFALFVRWRTCLRARHSSLPLTRNVIAPLLRSPFKLQIWRLDALRKQKACRKPNNA